MTVGLPPPRQRTLFPDHVGGTRAVLFGKVTRLEYPGEGRLPLTVYFVRWDGASAPQWSRQCAAGQVFPWEDAVALAGRLGGTAVVERTR